MFTFVALKMFLRSLGLRSSVSTGQKSLVEARNFDLGHPGIGLANQIETSKTDCCPPRLTLCRLSFLAGPGSFNVFPTTSVKVKLRGICPSLVNNSGEDFGVHLSLLRAAADLSFSCSLLRKAILQLLPSRVPPCFLFD